MMGRVLLISVLIVVISCKKEIGNNSFSNEGVKAGIIPDSYLFYHNYNPDTIYLINKYYDLNDDSLADIGFLSKENTYNDHGKQGFFCEANIATLDSNLKIAAFKLGSTDLIHYNDEIDSTLRWIDWQTYGRSIELNSVTSTRGYFNQFYWDSTGYIGLEYKGNYGWLKIKVEGCNKIILYEYLIK